MKQRIRKEYFKLCYQAFTCFLSTLLVVATSPMAFAAPAAPDYASIASAPIPEPPQPMGGVKTGPRQVKLFKSTLNLSDNPSDLEIRTARVFLEPLIPMTSQPIAGENAALSKEIKAFKA